MKSLILKMMSLAAVLMLWQQLNKNTQMLTLFFAMAAIVKDNIPEMSVSDIDFKFSVGGEDKKIQVVGF